MRIVTTGGRDFTDRELVRWALRLLRPDDVAHGACGMETNDVGRTTGTLRGADLLADEEALGIANLRRFPVSPRRFPVDHDIDGPWPAAGPRRNQRMLDSFRPDLVLAFDGGKGTADCCRKARTMEIRVLKAKRVLPNVFAIEEWRT